jgi:hypothetical protein
MITRAETCFRYGLAERLTGSQDELCCMGLIYPNRVIHSPVSMSKSSMDKLVGFPEMQQVVPGMAGSSFT